MRPETVELRPKRADLRAFFWGKSSEFFGVFAGFGRLRAANRVKPKGGAARFRPKEGADGGGFTIRTEGA
jgi:hypothetical protein